MSSVSMITSLMKSAAETPRVRLSIATEKGRRSFIVLWDLGFRKKVLGLFFGEEEWGRVKTKWMFINCPEDDDTLSLYIYLVGMWILHVT